MSITAACIDITGSNRPMDVAYLDGKQLHLRTESNLDDFVSWVSEKSPGIVAVDAPSKQNIGLVPANRTEFNLPNKSYENYRIAEAVLKTKNIGLYTTPKQKPPKWMERGWECYSRLRSQGYSLLETAGRVAPSNRMVMEVHPHAAFVVGLGWVPQLKETLAGLLERAAFLRREFRELELSAADSLLEVDQLRQLNEINTTWDRIADEGITLPSLSHDQLDAIAGLVTAVRVQRGDAEAVGHPEDGVIVIPKPLADEKYQYKHK